MQTCSSCRASAPERSRFCPSCGAPLGAEDDTRLAATPAARVRATPAGAYGTPAAVFDHGRFLPGTTVGDRYRVTGRAGRGGMGEVYRADDLRLGQQVALKFLSDELASNAERLAQFHAEVRLARQVSHPNVCRVYDVGEDEGRTFLSMEYIDGEDLASLIRRIGRLPQDKALELSRELCAGLAAAHERGVIHRDLKPANLMIDAEGRLRIADFGIAALESAGGAAAGTPGYMAPELLTGAPATTRSDIYALGLVLYELFTGRKAYAQPTLAELVRAQQETAPTSPATYVRDLDPAIERTILRCLERDPNARPASAMAVSAMLPGGDPLAAALAAGETPSPEMIAAAGETDAIAPWRGVALVLAAAAAAAALLAMADRTYLVNLVPLPKPPAVLADRAAAILADAGYRTAVGQADGFTTSPDYLNYVEAHDRRSDRWKRLRDARGPTVLYWFRISPRMIVPMGATARPALHDPPMNISGQAGVILDPSGRLLELHGVPPQYDTAALAGGPADWRRLFEAAALEMARFSTSEPRWTPRVYADSRVAWTGPAPDDPDTTIRIEAASYRGSPVFFSVIGPWTQPGRMVETPRSRTQVVLSVIGQVLLIVMLCGASLLAWRNARRGRGDRRGATRVAVTMLLFSVSARMLLMYHVADPGVESERFFVNAVALALLDFGLLWVLYMAVEPSIRRFWPDSLLGWSRLLAGHVRDPRVGRDLLYGTVGGLAIASIGVVHDFLLPLFGALPPRPTTSDLSRWLGTQVAAGSMLLVARNAFQSAGIALFGIVVLRMLLRSRALAAIGAVLFFVLLDAAQFASSATPAVDVTFALVIVALMTTVIVRVGLLAAVVMFFTYNVVNALPLTSAFGAWYGHTSALGLALLVAVATTGFWLARGRAPLFGRPLLEE